MNSDARSADIPRCTKVYLEALEDPDVVNSPADLSWVSETGEPEVRVYTSYELRGDYLVTADYTATYDKVTIGTINARHISTIVRIVITSGAQGEARIYGNERVVTIPIRVARQILGRTLAR